MIDLKKKYKTRSELDVELWKIVTDKQGAYLYGGYWNDGYFVTNIWGVNGADFANSLDLIEVNPQQELLDKAHRDYPVGTMVGAMFGAPNIWECTGFYKSDSKGCIYDDKTSCFIYMSGRGWAKRVKAVTTVEYIDID
jgi:hypothetical protein